VPHTVLQLTAAPGIVEHKTQKQLLVKRRVCLADGGSEPIQCITAKERVFELVWHRVVSGSDGIQYRPTDRWLSTVLSSLFRSIFVI
jgi:hypothetical protein